MYERDYAYTIRITGSSVGEVSERVRAALSAEDFAVTTELDVQATLKKRLGVERKPFVILVACDPPLVHRVLEAEPPLGLFLPLRVSVFEGEDGAVYVQTPKPPVLLGLAGQSSLLPIAAATESKLQRILGVLGG